MPQNIYSNTSDFSVQPRDAKPIAQRRKVRLYYIGTRLLRDGKSPLFNVKGRIYQMPPIGEYIEVDELTAKEIASRCEWRVPNADPIPGVTTDPEAAKAVKQAFENGVIDSLDVRKIIEANAVKNVDTNALLEELKRRGADVNELLAASQKTEEPEAITQPEKPATKGGKKATSS